MILCDSQRKQARKKIEKNNTKEEERRVDNREKIFQIRLLCCVKQILCRYEVRSDEVWKKRRMNTPVI